MMNNRRPRQVRDMPPCLTGPQTEVSILRAIKNRLVKQTYGIKNLSPDHLACPDNIDRLKRFALNH